MMLRFLARNLAVRPRKILNLSSDALEGDEDVIRIERYIGRLHGLLQRRKSYATNVRAVNEGRWRPGSRSSRLVESFAK